MKKLLIGMTLALGACGISQDKFNEEFAATYCEKNNECLAAGELEPIDCEADAVEGDPVEVDCEYDKKVAKDCLDALETADCDEDLHFLIVPSICADVCPVAADDTDA